jgi:hypothetical protein
MLLIAFKLIDLNVYMVFYTGPQREFARPGANLLWAPHDITIFKLDPSQAPTGT